MPSLSEAVCYGTAMLVVYVAGNRIGVWDSLKPKKSGADVAPAFSPEEGREALRNLYEWRPPTPGGLPYNPNGYIGPRPPDNPQEEKPAGATEPVFRIEKEKEEFPPGATEPVFRIEKKKEDLPPGATEPVFRIEKKSGVIGSPGPNDKVAKPVLP